MYLLYNLLLLLCFILYLPLLLIKVLSGKATEVKEQLGFLPRTLLNDLKNERVIWVHGVSVGETVAASPICAEIRNQFPQAKIVFSTVTITGRVMAEKLIPADGFIYFPIDLPMVVKKVLAQLKPELVVIMETELWPNFIRAAHRMGCKVILANGRISDRSARRYNYVRSLMEKMLRNMDALIMQSPQDVKYIMALGAEKEKVFYFGNTKYDKFDLDSDVFKPAFKDQLAKEMQIEGAFPVLVAGSTHANEEELLIPVYRKLKAEFKDLVMILAPRHLERLNEIKTLYEKADIPVVQRTELSNKQRNEQVIILDTIGELFSIYSLADLVFIGGTLAKIGGHNILEPAAHGRVIFVGPYMFNFKEIHRLFLKRDALIQVQDPEELAEKMLLCLRNREKARIIGQNALRIIQENQGAARKMVDLLAAILQECSSG